MKRKVIKQANQAFTITLPIDWVRSNNISEKSELDLTVNGKSIVLSTEGQTVGGSASLNLDDVEEKFIYRHLSALYARGIDEIRISCKEDISASLIDKLNCLLGYTLVSQSQNEYVIKDLNASGYSNLDEIFKRVFQVILLFYESAIKDIFGNSKEKIEHLKSRDLEVNKLCLFLERAVNKSSYNDVINGRVLFTYSFELEKIGDEIERLWRTNIKYKVKKSKELESLVRLSFEGLSQAFDLYYQFTSKKTKEIFVIRDKVREKSLELKGIDPITARFVRHAVKIAEDAADLTHLTMIRAL